MINLIHRPSFYNIFRPPFSIVPTVLNFIWIGAGIWSSNNHWGLIQKGWTIRTVTGNSIGGNNAEYIEHPCPIYGIIVPEATVVDSEMVRLYS